MVNNTHIEKLLNYTTSPEYMKRMREFVLFMEQPIGKKRFIHILREIISQPNRYATIDNSQTITLQQAKTMIVDFYRLFDIEIGNRVAHILNNEDNHIRLNITEDPQAIPSGNVKHADMDTFITINCIFDNTIHGSTVLAHEIGHAISNNISILAKLSAKMAQTNKSSTYTSYSNHKDRLSSQKPLYRDAIGEVESHIFETLYYDYLLDKEVISNAFYDNLLSIRQNSLYNNILILLEDYQCIKNLRYPISMHNVNNRIHESKLPLGHIQDFLNRFEDNGFMFQHRIKYVIGELVTANWIDKYHATHTQRARSQMKHRLISFLNKSYAYDVDSACMQLLKQDFATITHEYAKTPRHNFLSKENNNEQTLL